MVSSFVYLPPPPPPHSSPPFSLSLSLSFSLSHTLSSLFKYRQGKYDAVRFFEYNLHTSLFNFMWAPMGSPSHGGGVSRLSLPTPFSPIFVCPSAYWNLSSVLLFTHQLLPTYLQFSSSDCPSCLHRPFAYISLLYKPSFATSLFLCGPLETRHVDCVPLPSYRLNSPTPTADQVEEENLQLPTVVKAEEGNTLLQVKAVGQMVLASPERQTVYAMETQNTNPGRMDPPAR